MRYLVLAAVLVMASPALATIEKPTLARCCEKCTCTDCPMKCETKCPEVKPPVAAAPCEKSICRPTVVQHSQPKKHRFHRCGILSRLRGRHCR